jgi:ATP-dependent RNA helicase RhlB
MIKKFLGKILSKKDDAGKKNASKTSTKNIAKKDRTKNSDSYIQVKETEVWEPGQGKSTGNKSNDKNKSKPAQRNRNADTRDNRKPTRDNNDTRDNRRPAQGNKDTRDNRRPTQGNNDTKDNRRPTQGNNDNRRPNSNRPNSKNLDEKKQTPNKTANDRNKPVSKVERDSKPADNNQKQQARPPKPARKPREPEKPYTWTLDQYVVEPKEDAARFHDFDLPLKLMNGIADNNFQYCTPIQAMSLPHSLAGKDVCAKALTGTGKTAAFLLTVQTLLWRTRAKERRPNGQPRALILAPTRELCMQICKDSQKLGTHMPFTSFAVFGGMDLKKQQNFLQTRVVDIVAATPGRLLAFSRSRDIDLSQVEILIIDEADRMLDMGFIQDIKKIIYKTPHKDKRQTMLFSATLSKDIINLASQWMREQVVIEDKADDLVVDDIDQQIYLVTSDQKFGILKKVLKSEGCTKALVFANRKSTTRRLSEKLSKAGIKNEMLSGDVPQKKRVSVLERFKSDDIKVIVATDVAGRGIHVDGISHVINFELPYEADDYVHRIGRTGRAGHKGQAISFACEDESFIIPDIEKYMNCELKCSMPPEELLD